MSHFPNPRNTSPEGLIAVGGDLTPEFLIDAYSHGIFPWPQETYPLLWFCPDPRGVLDFSEFHVPRSLVKWSRQQLNWRFTLNQAFPQVIKSCREQQRPGQEGTWITEDIEKAYQIFFQLGHILSMECWEDETLIGGIYGVFLKGVFSGESMFHHETNASKMAFWKMVEHLKSIGLKWMDIQMVTPVTESFGGKYISREEYLQRIGQ